MTWDEERSAKIERSPTYSRPLTVAAYWFLSAVLVAAAIATASLRVEFDDTATSVVNGLHRYMTEPHATDLRWAFLGTVVLLLAAAVCSVLAAVEGGKRVGPILYRRTALSASAVLGLLVALWFIAPPAFSPRVPPQPAPPATALPSRGPFSSIPPAPTTVPRP